MTRAGEHLYLGDDRGLLDPSQGWEIEVRECAEFGKPLPVSAFAVNIATPSIRNVTADFHTAVRRHSRPDDHEADETFMLHASFRRTA